MPVDRFDETLFAELQRMTPEQRLDLNDRTIAMIEEMRIAFTVADDDRRDAGSRKR